MEKRMHEVLAWLRFLAWGVFYALLLVGSLLVGGAVLLLPGVVSIWLWGDPRPGVAVTGFIILVAGGLMIADANGKAPR